jgi:hypothetical protein
VLIQFLVSNDLPECWPLLWDTLHKDTGILENANTLNNCCLIYASAVESNMLPSQQSERLSTLNSIQILISVGSVSIYAQRRECAAVAN